MVIVYLFVFNKGNCATKKTKLFTIIWNPCSQSFEYSSSKISIFEWNPIHNRKFSSKNSWIAKDISIRICFNWFSLYFSCSIECKTAGGTSTIISGSSIWPFMPKCRIETSSCNYMVARWCKSWINHRDCKYIFSF